MFMLFYWRNFATLWYSESRILKCPKNIVGPLYIYIYIYCLQLFQMKKKKFLHKYVTMVKHESITSLWSQIGSQQKWKPSKVTKDTNISRQCFGFRIFGCAKYFVHQLPGEKKNHQYEISYSIISVFERRNCQKWSRKKCSFTKTMHRVTNWSQLWQNYMNCTLNCFCTHPIL